MESNQSLYTEEQRISRNGLWLFCIMAPAIILALLYYQRFSGKEIFEYTLHDGQLLTITILYLIPAVLCLLKVKMTTKIDRHKISYGWNIPTAELNEVKLEDIESCGVIAYKFEGYGYRISSRYGTIYNVFGNMGLQIKRKSGRKLLIGTNNPEELEKVIRSLGIPQGA